MTNVRARLAGCAAILLALSGCNPAYLAQAAGGQVRLLASRRPVPEVLADARTDPAVRLRLQTASAALRFAHEDLDLPDNGSYRDYVSLDRPFVVWNVFAAEEFSLRLHTWCFPFAGCVAYRGYFDERAARRFASRQASSGRDVVVIGAAAYSTLGYFRDPLLSTLVGLPEDRVAALVFHELAHQRFYVGGDTVFNESFATLVEEEGMIRWLDRRGGTLALCRYLEGRERERQVRRLLAGATSRLGKLYASGRSDVELRREKAAVFEELRRRYGELSAGWSGAPNFDGWFARDMNNASLGALSAYDQLVGTLRVILESEGGNLPAFYRRIARLGRLGKAGRTEVLGEIRSVSESAGAGPGCRGESPGSAAAVPRQSRAVAGPSVRARG